MVETKQHCIHIYIYVQVIIQQHQGGRNLSKREVKEANMLLFHQRELKIALQQVFGDMIYNNTDSMSRNGESKFMMHNNIFIYDL